MPRNDRDHDRQRLRGLRRGCRPLRPDGGPQSRVPRPPAFGRRGPAGAAAFRVPQVLRVLLADLGCGSGASTRALVRAAHAARAYRLGSWRASTRRPACWTRPGPSPGPPESPSRSAWRRSWPLPARPGVSASPVPGVFAAYLFRNVTERDKVLAAVYDLLADEGTLVVQEYSVQRLPGRPRLIWSLVCWTRGHPAELAHLPPDPALPVPVAQRARRSTRSHTFVDRLYAAGFVDVQVRTVPGWQHDILHTFRARKPAVSRLVSRSWRPAAGDRAGVRAVRHPATTRRGAQPVEGPVLVAGGGIAGMAAAVGTGRAWRAGDHGRAAPAARRPGAGVAGAARR